MQNRKQIYLFLSNSFSPLYFDVHNVFPEYFVISVPLFDGIIKDELDEWLYFAKHSEVKDDFKSPYMKKVAERLSVLKMTPEERQHYQNYVNESLKERDYIVAARTEGRAEEKIAMAKKMLKENFSIETISRIIELSIEEIEWLRKNLAEDTTTVLDEN